MKTKLQIRKSFSVILLLFLSAVVCNSQDNLAKKTVDNFLNVWLVKKNMKLVQKNFAKDMFDNQYLFSNSCLGEPIKFLSDISQATKGKTLKNMLVSGDFKYEFNEGLVLSNEKKDKYFLVKVGWNDLLNISGRDENDVFYQNLSYLKSKFPSKNYLFQTLLIKVELEKEKVIAPIYLIWTFRGSSWKLVQIGMECQ